MPAVKTYTRVNFQNYPSTSTPLNATNLNKMDKGIDDLDDEVVTVKNAIENMNFDADAISYNNTQSGLQATDVQGAVDEINDNLAQTPITKGGVTLSTIDDKLNYLVEGAHYTLVAQNTVSTQTAQYNITEGKNYIVVATLGTLSSPSTSGTCAQVVDGVVSYDYEGGFITVSVSNGKIVLNNSMSSTYVMAYFIYAF